MLFLWIFIYMFPSPLCWLKGPLFPGWANTAPKSVSWYRGIRLPRNRGSIFYSFEGKGGGITGGGIRCLKEKLGKIRLLKKPYWKLKLYCWDYAQKGKWECGRQTVSSISAMKEWEKSLAQGQGDVDLAKRRYVEVAVTWVVPLNERGEGKQLVWIRGIRKNCTELVWRKVSSWARKKVFHIRGI